MQNELLAVKDMTQQMMTVDGQTLISFLSGAKKNAEKNLMRTLRDHVTYPVELIAEMNAYGDHLVSSLKNFDERIVYEWDGYSDDDKKELLRLANEQGSTALGRGLMPAPIEFVDFPDDAHHSDHELMGKFVYADAEIGTSAALLLSNKLLRRSIVEAVGVMAHEQAHGLVSQFSEQAENVTQGKSGVMWSKYGDHEKIYLNPEEALVRAFETNVVETLGAGTATAARMRDADFERAGYARMAAAKHYFDLTKK